MYATDYKISELMAVCIAREIEDGDTVILGSFTPLAYAAYMLAKVTHAPNMMYVAYSAVDARPFQMSFFTSEAAATRGAAALWSMTECINSIHVKGKGDVEAVSGAQVDRFGDINISVIGPYDKPIVRLPGGAGAAEVIKMHKKMIGYFPNHTKQTFVEKVDFVTGTRYLYSPEERKAAGLQPGPIRFITNLCVMSLERRGDPFMVESLHPGVTLEMVQENTSFPVVASPNIWETEPPTREQVELLRTKIDPYGTMEFDFRSGKERLAYLEELLRREYENA